MLIKSQTLLETRESGIWSPRNHSRTRLWPGKGSKRSSTITFAVFVWMEDQLRLTANNLVSHALGSTKKVPR